MTPLDKNPAGYPTGLTVNDKHAGRILIGEYKEERNVGQALVYERTRGCMNELKPPPTPPKGESCTPKLLPLGKVGMGFHLRCLSMLRKGTIMLLRAFTGSPNSIMTSGARVFPIRTA